MVRAIEELRQPIPRRVLDELFQRDCRMGLHTVALGELLEARRERNIYPRQQLRTLSGLIPFSEHWVTRPARKLCAAILAMSDAGNPALLAARLRMRGIESALRL